MQPGYAAQEQLQAVKQAEVAGFMLLLRWAAPCSPRLTASAGSRACAEDDATAPSRPLTSRKSAAAGREAATSRRRQSTRTPAVARIAEEGAEGTEPSDGSRSRGTARARRGAAADAAAGSEEPAASVGRTPRAGGRKGSSRLAA